VYKPEEIVYIDEAGMDNRENYSYGWNQRGQRFYDIKSGRRQGRINTIARAFVMDSYWLPLLLRVLVIERSLKLG